MTHDVSHLRNQLLANGYKILPNRGKIPALPGWNAPEFIARELRDGPKGTAAQRVASWSKRFPDAPSTGLLICDGLVAVDIDVDDEIVCDTVLFMLPDNAPVRFRDGSFKAAVFCRLDPADQPFVRIASPRYDGHCVEMFGGKRLNSGNVSRQFGIYGPHSFHDDGSVEASYQWAEGVPALHQIAAHELPIVTMRQLHGIIDAFERQAEVSGWQREARPATDGGRAVYDIDEATRFDTDRGGRQIDYAGLSDELAAWRVALRL
jgi:hypothetical protein